MGLGTVLGGALAGLGKGLSQQGELDYNRLREEALERLRSQNRRAEMGDQSRLTREEIGERADLEDRNATRSDTRRTQGQLTVDAARATADERRDSRRFQQEITLKKIDAENTRALAVLNSKLDRAETAEAINLKAAIDKGDTVDTLMGSNGNYWGRRRDGSVYDTGLGYATTSDRKGDAGQSGGTLAAAIAKRKGGGGEAAAQTFTRAEAEQTAKARGVPVQSVISTMEAAGWKMAR